MSRGGWIIVVAREEFVCSVKRGMKACHAPQGKLNLPNHHDKFDKIQS